MAVSIRSFPPTTIQFVKCFEVQVKSLKILVTFMEGGGERSQNMQLQSGQTSL